MSQPTWWRGGRGLPSLIALFNLVSTFDTTPHFTAAIRASGLRLRLRVSVTIVYYNQQSDSCQQTIQYMIVFRLNSHLYISKNYAPPPPPTRTLLKQCLSKLRPDNRQKTYY